MKRILHITGTMNRAGAETMVMHYYRNIDRSQYQFDFLYFTDKKCDFDDEIIAMGGKIYRVPYAGLKRYLHTYKFLKSNRSFFAIHGHTLLNNGFNMLFAYLAGFKKRVAHSHNTTSSVTDNTAQRLYYIFSKFLINTFGNVFIACGIEAGKYLFYKSKKVTVLPNAVDFDLFDKNEPTFLKKDLGLDDQVLLICQIARLSPVKNHSFSVKVAQQLKAEGVNFHMLFVGVGDQKEAVEKHILELNLSDKITLLGLRTDIPQILHEADVAIMPSLFEGFPVALVESQVAGIPTIVSSSVSPEVDLGVDLIFFEDLSTSPEVWSKKILDCRHRQKKLNKDHWSILREQGFDSKTNANKLLQLYNE